MLEVAAAFRVFMQRDLSVVICVKWVFVRVEWTEWLLAIPRGLFEPCAPPRYPTAELGGGILGPNPQLCEQTKRRYSSYKMLTFP